LDVKLLNRPAKAHTGGEEKPVILLSKLSYPVRDVSKTSKQAWEGDGIRCNHLAVFSKEADGITEPGDRQRYNTLQSTLRNHPYAIARD
jgi:hypothetical protein